MKIVAAVLGLMFAAYAGWLLWFSATGVKYIEHDSQYAAAFGANLAGINEGFEADAVIGYMGDSNTLFSAQIIQGFIIIDKIPYSEIQKRDFVVYEHSRIGLVCHSARVHNADGTWILEGDGNLGHDDELLTPDNYVGVMYKKTVWKY